MGGREHDPCLRTWSAQYRWCVVVGVSRTDRGRSGPAGRHLRPAERNAPGLPTAPECLAACQVARQLGRDGDPAIRQNLVRLYTLERLAAMTGHRARELAERGGELPGLPQLTKMAGNHQIRLSRQVVFEILKEVGTLFGYNAESVTEIEVLTGIDGLGEIVESAIFASAPPIYGGSDQIQRNILGERVLGLPREPGDDRNVPFKDLRKN